MDGGSLLHAVRATVCGVFVCRASVRCDGPAALLTGKEDKMSPGGVIVVSKKSGDAASRVAKALLPRGT